MQKYVPYLKWFSVLILPFLVYYSMPVPEVAPLAPIFMALTITAVFILAIEIIPMEAAVVILTALYVLFDIAPPARVFAPWTSGTVWMVFGSLILGYVIIKTGLAKRIALVACVKMGGSYLAVMFGLASIGVILGPVVSSAIGKCVIVAAIAVGCCEVLKLEPQSKAATGLMLAGFYGIGPAHWAYMTGGVDVLMGIGLFKEAMPDYDLSWLDYFVHNAPISFLMTIVAILAAYFMLRPKSLIDSEALRAQLRAMPAMSLIEKKAAFLLVFLLMVFLTESIHGFNINFAVLLLSGLVFVPQFNLLSKADLPKINLWMVVFVAGCISIGTTAMTIGVDKWLASLMAPFLEGSSLSIFIKIYCSGILANFVLTPLAAISSMTVPLIEIMNTLGANPLGGLYVFMYGLDQYLFPYEIALLLYFYATGYMSLKWLIICLAVRMAISIVTMIAVAYPYWSMLGLF